MNHENLKPETTQQQRPIYRWSISRREFVAAAGLLTGGAVMGFPIRGSGVTVIEVEQTAAEAGAMPLQLTINGKQHQLTLDPRTTLLDLLREPALKKVAITASAAHAPFWPMAAASTAASHWP